MDFDILMQQQEQIIARLAADPTERSRLRAMFAASVGVGDVTRNSTLTNIAIGYANEDYIADDVMPVVEVPKKSGDFFVFDPSNNFNLIDPDMASGRGTPNEADYKLGTSTYSVKDRSLMSFLPLDVEASAEPPLEMQATEIDNIMNGMSLAREWRVASAVFSSANYGANTAALAGSARFDDYTNSNPAATIDSALDSCIVRPNVAVIGVDVWAKLREHPKMKELIISRASSANGNSPLRVTMELFAAAFGLSAVYVPRARYNTARAPAAMSLSYVWNSKRIALIRVERNPNIRKTSTFGYTYRFANNAMGRPATIVQSWFDQRPGVSGVSCFKVSMSDDEKIVGGGYAGYLLDTVVS